MLPNLPVMGLSGLEFKALGNKSYLINHSPNFLKYMRHDASQFVQACITPSSRFQRRKTKQSLCFCGSIDRFIMISFIFNQCCERTKEVCGKWVGGRRGWWRRGSLRGENLTQQFIR